MLDNRVLVNPVLVQSRPSYSGSAAQQEGQAAGGGRGRREAGDGGGPLRQDRQN